jgi:beclin 1
MQSPLVRETQLLTADEDIYKTYLQSHNEEEEAVKNKPTNVVCLKAENESLDQEIDWYREKIKSVKLQKRDVEQRRRIAAEDILKARILHDALLKRMNQLTCEDERLNEQLNASRIELSHIENIYDRYKQIVSLNDVFYIWYTNSFGTINSFRLGTIPSKPVDFAEINAALGQAVLALHIISTKAGITFKTFQVLPLASTSKMIKVDDKRTMYPLFIDSGTFSLFPKRNFNSGLSAMVSCMIEIGDFISEHDPTLTVPHLMSVADSKIADLSFVYGGSDGDEVWTRALKYMLANIKWMITWHSKNNP